MEQYNITDFTGTVIVNRSRAMVELKKRLKTLIKSNYTKYTKSDIGMIIISCIPLDSNYFIELDGRVVSKEVYKDLYAIYSDKFTNDKNDKYTLNTDKEFVLPNCYDRAMIMIDKSGKLDNSDRTLGSNLPWGINIDKLLDFDLTNQLKVIKNVEDSDEEDKNINEIYSNIEIGSDAYITKKTRKYSVRGNVDDDLINDVRRANQLKFNTRKIFFYTRYKTSDVTIQ